MIKVESITFAGQDERGVTAEIDSLNRGGKYILAYRKAGSLSGNHYHQGISAMKDPEVVFLLQGKVNIRYARVADGNKGEEQSIQAEAPARIEVAKNTWHLMEFLSDACFFELNSFAEGDKDTFRI
ncbi:MAG: hypothetical protein EP332_00255 [Bacteroidetes bacterium]|nr:MAG: hypothetical protein EP332_00255 [Bacteroidota bacterium]